MQPLKHLNNTAMNSEVMTSGNRYPVNRQMVNRQPVLLNLPPLRIIFCGQTPIKQNFPCSFSLGGSDEH